MLKAYQIVARPKDQDTTTDLWDPWTIILSSCAIYDASYNYCRDPDLPCPIHGTERLRQTQT